MSSVSLTPPGYSASSPGCGYEVAFSGPMPRSRSPHGIQFDSPLQRQWMIRSSNGRIARNAATVFGARSSSNRATKWRPAALISSTAATLSGAEPAREQVALGLGHVRDVPEGHRPEHHRLLLDRPRLGLDLSARVEPDALRRRREPGLRRVR